MWSSIIVWLSASILIHLFSAFSQCDYKKKSLPGFTGSFKVFHFIYQQHVFLSQTDSSHLDIAVVVASVTAVAWVHQNSIEAVHYRVAWALRHVGSDIQEFWVAHILKTPNRIMWSLKNEELNGKNWLKAGERSVNLCYFASAEVGEPLQWDGQDIRGPMDCETFGRWHFLFAPEWG